MAYEVSSSSGDAEAIPALPPGVSAIIAPDFGAPQGETYKMTPTQQEVLGQLNDFLGELAKQGAELVNFVQLPTGDSTSRMTNFAFVRKPGDVAPQAPSAQA